jgi:hypothetical protein
MIKLALIGQQNGERERFIRLNPAHIESVSDPDGRSWHNGNQTAWVNTVGNEHFLVEADPAQLATDIQTYLDGRRAGQG